MAVNTQENGSLQFGEFRFPSMFLTAGTSETARETYRDARLLIGDSTLGLMCQRTSQRG
ncbi:hypothetical protein [Williamsia muralis]|uniref:hypothetical protein n=1 Tax=Williamsia marianensis TaxID=85044 RepID=UPI003801EF82